MSCYGDYSSNNGPNCDEGYVVLKTIAYDDAGLQSVTISKPTECGGKRSNCYMGPGVDYSVTKEGIPVPIDTLAYNGESINYSVTAPGPLGKGFYSNHYISNFTALFSTGLNSYDQTTILSTTGLEVFSATSVAPTAAAILPGNVTTADTFTDEGRDPLKSADTTLYHSGANSWNVGAKSYKINPFYEFSCLNYAHEVKARVRVQVREWNQAFRKPVASYTEVEESAPARLLNQGLETSGVGYWNDMMNWDTPTISDYATVGDNSVLAPTMLPVPVTDYGYNFPFQGN
jgi:hypothetical protein